jgi:hypothetical protein
VVDELADAEILEEIAGIGLGHDRLRLHIGLQRRVHPRLSV